MKFHNLYISTNNSFEIYHKITDVLGIMPKQEDGYDIWTYQVVTNEEDEYFDYINVFLDLLEPKFERLRDLNIHKEDITIWLFYEYNKQCSMSFDSQEMKRLGENGIALNIDCISFNN